MNRQHRSQSTPPVVAVTLFTAGFDLLFKEKSFVTVRWRWESIGETFQPTLLFDIDIFISKARIGWHTLVFPNIAKSRLQDSEEQRYSKRIQDKYCSWSWHELQSIRRPYVQPAVQRLQSIYFEVGEHTSQSSQLSESGNMSIKDKFSSSVPAIIHDFYLPRVGICFMFMNCTLTTDKRNIQISTNWRETPKYQQLAEMGENIHALVLQVLAFLISVWPHSSFWLSLASG